MMRTVLSILVLLALVGGCAGPPPSIEPEQPSTGPPAPVSSLEPESIATEPPASSSSPFGFGFLITRNHEITLMTSEDGPLYSVADRQGAVLATEMTEDVLAAWFPDLHEVLESSVADRAMVWAGLETDDSRR